MNKKYIVDKVGIRSDSVFYSNEDFEGKFYDSLDQAVAESALDVSNEIGMKLDDLVVRFEEVGGYLRSGQTYSFAGIVWQIKEIDD